MYMLVVCNCAFVHVCFLSWSDYHLAVRGYVVAYCFTFYVAEALPYVARTPHTTAAVLKKRVAVISRIKKNN